jgi:hypothetical protein
MKIVAVLLLNVMACFAQIRTDDLVVQPLNPPPDMGSAIGQNRVFTDARFNNNRTLRATDGKTAPVANASLQTADSGEPNLWASDARHFLVHMPSGKQQVLAFDHAKFQVTNTPLRVSQQAGFAWTNSQTIFELQGTQLHVRVASADWTVLSDTLLFDFKTCLGSIFNLTWTGQFLPKRDDQTFVVAFSNAGGQGSGHHLAAFRVGKGCRIYDTAAGTVTGSWGTTGTIDDGIKPLADRFTLHDAGGGQNEHVALITPSGHQPGGASGCLAGNCFVNSPYDWEIETTHVRICGGFNCDGHSAKGYQHEATGKRYTLHDYEDPSQPLTPLLLKNSFCSDMHGSWHNSTRTDSNPLFAVTTDVPSLTVYPCAAYNEVISVAADGSGVRSRHGQTLNTGTSKYFIIQNAIGAVDQSGHYVLFTSDWMGTLGKEKDGITPRGDVFILEIK